MRVRRQSLHTSLVANVPDADGLIVAGREHIFAARMESDSPHPIIMSIKRKQAQSGCHIPHSNRLVARSWRQEGPGMSSFIVGSCRLIDSCRCRIWRPRDALNRVVVLTHLHLALFRVDAPHANCVIVGARGHQLPLGMHSHHPHPFTVASVRLHAISGGYFPHFDGFVAGSGQKKITSRHKRHRAHIMVMAVHRFDAFKRLLKVPQFDWEIRAAGS